MQTYNEYQRGGDDSEYADWGIVAEWAGGMTTLDKSNYKAILRELGGEGNDVEELSLSGGVKVIVVRPDTEMWDRADDLSRGLQEDYPVMDDAAYSRERLENGDDNLWAFYDFAGRLVGTEVIDADEAGDEGEALKYYYKELMGKSGVWTATNVVPFMVEDFDEAPAKQVKVAEIREQIEAYTDLEDMLMEDFLAYVPPRGDNPDQAELPGLETPEKDRYNAKGAGLGVVALADLKVKGYMDWDEDGEEGTGGKRNVMVFAAEASTLGFKPGDVPLTMKHRNMNWRLIETERDAEGDVSWWLYYKDNGDDGVDKDTRLKVWND
jgi:hypothetical protein